MKTDRLCRCIFAASSILLFFVSLRLPLSNADGYTSGMMASGNHGVNLLFSFIIVIVLVLVDGLSVFSETGPALGTGVLRWLMLAASYILIFAGWAAAFTGRSRTRRLVLAIIGSMLILAVGAELPFNKLASGFWAWLGCQIALLLGALCAPRGASSVI